MCLGKWGLVGNGDDGFIIVFLQLGFQSLSMELRRFFFKASPGLRQGDPLSPFLYLLVAEVFNKLMFKAKAGGCLKGFYVKENGMEISHLQFADDTIVFLDAKVEEV